MQKSIKVIGIIDSFSNFFAIFAFTQEQMVIVIGNQVDLCFRPLALRFHLAPPFPDRPGHERQALIQRILIAV